MPTDSAGVNAIERIVGTAQANCTDGEIQRGHVSDPRELEHFLKQDLTLRISAAALGCDVDFLIRRGRKARAGQEEVLKA